MGMRIGIFGGSFDPIHIGHLLLAEQCCESLNLERVLFLVANVSPFKTENLPTSNKDRIEMVKLAIGGNSKFVLDTREIDRGGVSYTIDSVKGVMDDYEDAELYLLMGADTLADIAKWRQPAELFQLVTPCVIARGGVGEPNWEVLRPYVDEERLGQIERAKVAAPQIEISSFGIRERLRSGKSIRYQVPASVEMYLREHSIFR